EPAPVLEARLRRNVRPTPPEARTDHADVRNPKRLPVELDPEVEPRARAIRVLAVLAARERVGVRHRAAEARIVVDFRVVRAETQLEREVLRRAVVAFDVIAPIFAAPVFGRQRRLRACLARHENDESRCEACSDARAQRFLRTRRSRSAIAAKALPNARVESP